ncbi:MAG: type II secretion system minor pseudopilin GspH [Cocleimonas sp.]|nr:type II secretion system minor pseudopilin GspH [Cocleimonas sp.]
MMISVVGIRKINYKILSKHSTRAQHAGFTLIEIMVVVVIVAVISSAVVPMMTKTTDDLLSEQADRFVALVNLAQNESILQSRQLGLQIDAQGYSFLQREDNSNNWVPFSEGPFRQRKLSAGTKTSIYMDDVDISSLTKEEVDEEGNKKIKPQVFILSSGEMTPFRYELAFSTGSRFKIIFDAIGTSKIEKLEGK